MVDHASSRSLILIFGSWIPAETPTVNKEIKPADQTQQKQKLHDNENHSDNDNDNDNSLLCSLPSLRRTDLGSSALPTSFLLGRNGDTRVILPTPAALSRCGPAGRRRRVRP